MKTKISIDILSDDGAGFLMSLVDLIGKNNAGKMELTNNDIITLAKMEKLKYPSSNKFLSVEEIEHGVLITAMEDKTPFCIITWKEIHELTPTEQDLLTQEHLS